MKNTEYRKGNLVQYCVGGESYVIGLIGGIKPDYMFNAITIFDTEDQSHTSTHSDNVKGIPITEELLDRFQPNRVVDYDANLSRDYRFDKMTIRFCNANGVSAFYRDRLKLGFIRELQYVHELQNLFFALTGQELEIKKEVGNGLS